MKKDYMLHIVINTCISFELSVNFSVTLVCVSINVCVCGGQVGVTDHVTLALLEYDW